MFPQKQEPSSPPENFVFNREKAIQELIRGRELADQLKIILDTSSESKVSNTKEEDLLHKILDSFTNTLSMLSNIESDEASQVPPVSSPDGRKSEESGDSIRSSTTKFGRGCYKRRKPTHTWTRDDSPVLLNDGHAWRKYGQKNILNSKFPRNYFRCTHKYDQKCKATKQVQKLQDHPPMFRTTYFGHHTCRNPINASQWILESDDTDEVGFTSVLISFDREDNNNQVTFSCPLIKEETREELSGPSSSNHLVYPCDYDHITALESCTPSSSAHSLDIDNISFDDFMF